jgi:DNA-binding XRE family transcriptional regulator
MTATTKESPGKLRVSLAGRHAGKITRALRRSRADGAIDILAGTKRAAGEIVMLTREDYEQLVDEAENKAASAAYERTRGEERVPLEMAERLVVGDNPVRVWREYRGLTLDALRSRTGLSKGYLSDIENAKRKGTVETLRAIARALQVDLDDLAGLAHRHT